jgi:hypothetical protein
MGVKALVSPFDRTRIIHKIADAFHEDIVACSTRLGIEDIDASATGSLRLATLAFDTIAADMEAQRQHARTLSSDAWHRVRSSQARSANQARELHELVQHISETIADPRLSIEGKLDRITVAVSAALNAA